MTWYLDPELPATNACSAAVTVVDGAPALSLMPHPRESPEALWFHVRLRRLDTGDSAPWLVLANANTLLGGGNGAAIQPVVRCDAGSWERLPRGLPVTHADGRQEARWRLPTAAASIEIAFCLPYAFEQLDRLITETRLRIQTIGATEQGRPFLRLDNGPGVEGSTRPGLYVLARQHSGETPGSWVLDGLLRRIAELGDAAPLTWAIPFADLDGVVEGRYGKDRHPVDYNRAWPGTDGIPRRHEALCICQDFARWRARCAPLLTLDLHAPGASNRSGVFVFAPRRSDGLIPTGILDWAEHVRRSLGETYAAVCFVRTADYPTRWPRETHSNFSRWVVNTQNLSGLTVETTYQGTEHATFSIDDYRAIGCRLIDAVMTRQPEIVR